MKKTSLNQKTNQLSQLLNEKNYSSPKLTKLKYLLEKSQNVDSLYQEKPHELSKDLPLFLSLIEKPLNLLFSIDQFVFEFSKTTYQQKKNGDFFQQLKERKKLSLFYGHLTRKQMVNLFKKAEKIKGYLSRNLFSLLERRLDVVIYRTGLTQTIAEARQLIKHNKIQVNNTRVNVSSYSLNPGDVISIKSEKQSGFIRQIVDTLNTDKQKPHSKVFEEYYSSLKKILNKSSLQGPFTLVTNSSNLSKKQSKNFYSKKQLVTNSSNLSNGKIKKRVTQNNFQSKQVCYSFIQFLLVRIKSRSFFSFLFINKKGLSSVTNSSNLSKLTSKHFSTKNNTILTLLKWKSSSTLRQGRKKIQYQKKFLKNYNSSVENFYATGGCLQKKPQFWIRDLFYQEKRKSFFVKNLKEFHPLKNKNRLLLKTSFLLFFKQLDIYKKFTGLTLLNFRKLFSKKLIHQNKSRFSKILHLRITKPIHLETSYNLLTSIFLFAPQRINYPFSLDLDLIKRSLR